jgi:hypothetical protein
MTRPTKTTEEKATVHEAPVVNEKEAIIAWLRTGRMNMFERSTRWLADRIEEGDHLK